MTEGVLKLDFEGVTTILVKAHADKFGIEYYHTPKDPEGRRRFVGSVIQSLADVFPEVFAADEKARSKRAG